MVIHLETPKAADTLPSRHTKFSNCDFSFPCPVLGSVQRERSRSPCWRALFELSRHSHTMPNVQSIQSFGSLCEPMYPYEHSCGPPTTSQTVPEGLRVVQTSTTPVQNWGVLLSDSLEAGLCMSTIQQAANAAAADPKWAVSGIAEALQRVASSLACGSRLAAQQRIMELLSFHEIVLRRTAAYGE